jgi:hypothetical protein
MALIDPRILTLIETLAEVGADRLAFEILEGVQAGEVLEESHDKLRHTQLSVRSRGQPIKVWGFEEPAPEPLSRPRTGDAQLSWAAAYVNQRLRDAVMMLDQSFHELESLLSTASTLERPAVISPTSGNITAVLKDDERELSVHRGGLASPSSEAHKVWPQIDSTSWHYPCSYASACHPF